MSEEIFISINSKKLLFQTIFITIFGFAGLIIGFGMAENTDLLEPWIWQTAGVVICLFSIIAAGAKMKKRSDSSAGVYLNKEGINDLSSDISLGLIKWRDIANIDEEQCRTERMLIIQVKDEVTYRKKAKNSAIGRLLDQNIRRYGTPVVIDPSYLKVTNEELLETALGELKKRR
ncbi:MAG: STM3941 family protein [Crocinitomicaceae bacterium]|nr:hypothetical protein [Crocinitomicaceae bacterium]